MGGAVAEKAGGIFDRARAGLGEEGVVERHEAILDGHGAVDVAVAPGLVHLGAEAGGDVGGDADAAMAAGGEEGERGVVFAGELAEIGADGGAGVERAGEVGGRILDADDVLVAGEAGHGLDRHVDDAAGRDVVDDDRQVDGVGDGAEVEIHALLCGPVVIGRDDEGGVGAGLFGVTGQFDRLGGAVGAGAGDDGDAAVGDFDGHFDDALVFGVDRASGFRRWCRRGRCRRCPGRSAIRRRSETRPRRRRRRPAWG